jgi:MiaB-like tRNA modifying enzyme
MNIYLETYGCTANKSDASIIRGILKKEKHNFVPTMVNADILILLTCTVIGTTEQRMLSRLRVFNKTKKPIIVSGCMPSVQSDEIKKIVPEAILLPSHHLQYIADVIQGKQYTFKPMNKTHLPKTFTDIVAPISIAEGCNLSCSYCITHIARGRLRSYPINEIVKDITHALAQGCKEIQITAQDTASYGHDIQSGLGALLRSICTIKGDFRIRIGMMNPFYVLQNTNSIFASFNDVKIYKFLHLPIQSGNNEILQKMKRNYTVEDCLDIIKQFRKYYKEGTIATDIIVGFPTETDEQFKQTIKLIQTIRPNIVNITRFSARPYTKAKIMNGRVNTETAKKRSRIATELCSTISFEENKNCIGKKYEILITKIDKQGTNIGRNENYKAIHVQDMCFLGGYAKVEIVDADAVHLYGKLI